MAPECIVISSPLQSQASARPADIPPLRVTENGDGFVEEHITAPHVEDIGDKVCTSFSHADKGSQWLFAKCLALSQFNQLNAMWMVPFISQRLWN